PSYVHIVTPKAGHVPQPVQASGVVSPPNLKVFGVILDLDDPNLPPVKATEENSLESPAVKPIEERTWNLTFPLMDPGNKTLSVETTTFSAGDSVGDSEDPLIVDKAPDGETKGAAEVAISHFRKAKGGVVARGVVNDARFHVWGVVVSDETTVTVGE